MTEINDITSLTKSVNRIAKALDQEFEGKNLTESLDAIADYIEENGVGGGSGGVYNVNCSMEEVTQGVTTYTLDKTWKEIHDAFMAGATVTVESTIPMQGAGSETLFDSVITVGTGKEEIVSEEGTFNYYYFVCFGSGYNVLSLMTDSENDYPTYTRT